jgi:hypothetical protein
MFGCFGFERAAQCGQVQVAVDAAELLAGLDHTGGAPAQHHLPVAPTFYVSGVLAADGDHRLYAVRRAECPRQRGWHAEAWHGERLVEALAQARRRAWVDAVEFFG